MILMGMCNEHQIKHYLKRHRLLLKSNIVDYTDSDRFGMEPGPYSFLITDISLSCRRHPVIN